MSPNNLKDILFDFSTVSGSIFGDHRRVILEAKPLTSAMVQSYSFGGFSKRMDAAIAASAGTMPMLEFLTIASFSRQTVGQVLGADSIATPATVATMFSNSPRGRCGVSRNDTV